MYKLKSTPTNGNVNTVKQNKTNEKHRKKKRFENKKICE
jgi:hypothetical protein